VRMRRGPSSRCWFLVSVLCPEPERRGWTRLWLIFSPSYFTWMDTNFPAEARGGVRPKSGTLVCRALLCPGSRKRRAGNGGPSPAGSGFAEDLFLERSRCLSGACTPSRVSRPAYADDALRPNQLLAVTLMPSIPWTRCDYPGACELLVPGAIRSLADRCNTLPIHHNGSLLNDRRPTGDLHRRRGLPPQAGLSQRHCGLRSIDHTARPAALYGEQGRDRPVMAHGSISLLGPAAWAICRRSWMVITTDPGAATPKPGARARVRVWRNWRLACRARTY
jgi:hypothetical protein